MVVALGAADGAAVLGPRLGDAALAEVVPARQLDGMFEDVEANGTQELLFQAAFPASVHGSRWDPIRPCGWKGTNKDYFVNVGPAEIDKKTSLSKFGRR